jgi:acylphosphatase
MVRSLQCVVSGKVQGVYFRSWIFDQAQSLGLKGWVRNLADGKIEVLAQGDDAALEELRKRLHVGSQLSRVEHVESNWIDYDKQYEEFQIRS